jgi:hypothetical protein
MSKLSRRSLVTAAATLPAIAIPAIANAGPEPDPVFAAIAAHRQAYVGYLKAAAREHENNYDGAALKAALAAASEAEGSTEQELAGVVPTTMAGVIALLRYCEEFEEQALALPEDPKNWHSGDPDCASLLNVRLEHATLLDKGSGEPLAPPIAYWIMRNVREALQSVGAIS